MKVEQIHVIGTMALVILACILTGLGVHVYDQAMQAEQPIIGTIQSCKILQEGLYVCKVRCYVENPTEIVLHQPIIFSSQEFLQGTSVELIKSPGIWIASLADR